MYVLTGVTLPLTFSRMHTKKYYNTNTFPVRCTVALHYTHSAHNYCIALQSSGNRVHLSLCIQYNMQQTTPNKDTVYTPGLWNIVLMGFTVALYVL